MMQFTKIAINRPVATLMCTLGLVFLGVISYRELPIQRLPEINFPSIFYWAMEEEEELTPDETNDRITRPFEKLVASLPGVREMHSQTREGDFWGYAMFERDTDMRFRAIELQDKAAKWAADNPNLRYEIVPQSTSEESGRLMQLVLSVPSGQEARIAEVAETIVRKIKSIDGINQVRVQGDMMQAVMLETERDALHANGLDVRNLIDAINGRAQDQQWLGILREGRREHPVKLAGKVNSVEELLTVPLDAEGIFTVGSLARPRQDVRERDSIYRINGKKAVHVAVNMEKDRNAVRMARQVRGRIGELRAQLPAGFEIIILEDVAETLEEMMKNLTEMAATGALLAMLVLLVFIRSFRIALVVLVTIPASILIAFNIMYGMGLTINILSLMGLTAGVGMLVDNSIVVVENVFRHWRGRGDPREAAWLGSREVGRAILVSTLTNLVVFVPLLYIDDEAVGLMRDMALSLVFPMTVSLIAAVTIVPMLTARMIAWGVRPGRRRDDSSWAARLNPWHRPGRPRNLFMELVMYFAKGAIRHPIRLFFTIAITLFLTMFAGAIKLAIQGMNPQQETSRITLYGKAPLGLELAETDKFFLEQEEQIRKAIAGSDVFETFSSRFDKDGGQIELNVARKYRGLREFEFHDAYRKQFVSGDDASGFRFRPFPMARGQMQEMGADRPSGQEKALVTGENMEAMLLAAEQVRAFLKGEPSIGEVFLDAPPGQPEVEYAPDQELFRIFKADLSRLGSDFSASDPRGIETALVMRDGTQDRRVRVKVIEPEIEQRPRAKKTLAELRRTKVLLGDGGAAPLENMGSFSVRQSTPVIVKTDRQRNVPVTFNLASKYYKEGMEKDRQDVLRELENKLLGMAMPSGVSVQMAGTLEEAAKQKQIWKKVLWSAAAAIYFVMAFFFESLFAPLIVLWTLPLAFIGGIWGIILLGARMDAVALLGTIMLAGLVVNNGILLIEYTRQLQDERRFRRSRALLSAVAYRVRPIMMTSLTTILGLVPILFSRESEEVARSLASVLIGGMIVSTLLALVVIPTFYNVAVIGLENLAILRTRVFRRRAQTTPSISPSTTSTVPTPSSVPTPSASSCPLLIEIENISKIYPLFTKRKTLHFLPSRSYPWGRRPPTGNQALRHVSLRIEAGMFGLLGPNGAGKTTLMKIITGIVPQTYGVVRVGGIDLRRDRESVRRMISYLPQNFGVYEALTLNQYLEFFAPFYGLNDRAERRRRIEEVCEWVGLADVRDKPMKRFSGGMRQRAGIAQILLRPAPIIIVDEPTAGLDPVERVRFRLLLAQLARTRVVVLSTHIVDDITSSCREVAVLNRGEVVYQGGIDAITATAHGMIWDVLAPADAPPPMAPKSILYKKHVEGRILYHYVSADPLPGSTPVEANFEDAYVALLMRHEARGNGHASRNQ